MHNTPCTILLIEDDKELLDLVGSYLEMYDYKVIKASNADEAMNAIDNNIQVIVSDFCIPNTSGPELIKRISQNINHVPNTIFLTGYGEEIIDKINLSTPFFVLFKPINFNQLLSAIEQSLENYSLSAA